MPRFAANLSLLYPEMPFLDRFEAAAKDGFEGVEFLFPYGHAAPDIQSRLAHNGLQQVLFNTPPGGANAAQFVAAWGLGDRGTACVPGREAEFRSGLLHALDWAQALGCTRVHTMVGLRAAHTCTQAADETLLANLHWAAAHAAQAGCQLLIEPINTLTMPGFHMSRQAHAHRVVQALDSPHVGVQMDWFHCHMAGDDVVSALAQYLPTGRVGHMQMADAPQRHEPGSGLMPWPAVWAELARQTHACDWPGWTGCEYIPQDPSPGGTSRGLAWRSALAASGAASA